MSKNGAKLLLISVFFARGTSFLFSKNLLGDNMTPTNIMAVRFLLAFLVLIVIFHKKMTACSKESLKGGLILGVLYTVCMLFEMYGLKTVDSGVCAFIENMAIILVPVFVAMMKRKLPAAKTSLCALIAVAGVGLLSLSQVSGGFNSGLILVILAALTYSWCIISTDIVSKKGDPITIGIIQLGIMGMCNLLISLGSGSFALPQTGTDWAMILMLALVCSSFGFTFQPVGQKYVDADTSAMLTVVNPLTASVMGFALAGEEMSLPKLLGYAAILIALIVFNKDTKKETSQD